MTPISQRTDSDCSQAAFASLLDLRYEDVPTMDGNEEDSYNDAIARLCREQKLFIVSLPWPLREISSYPGETLALATVASKRFPGKGHHVVVHVRTLIRGAGSYEWTCEVVHDPYKLEGPYEPQSIEFVLRQLPA